jgi:hypothetical protein
VTRFLRAFAQFWYDFIIGDDWKIAVAVLCAVAVATVLLVSRAVNDQVLAVLGGLLVLAAFAISLAIDVQGL